jgi:hypothetical protein
MMPAPSSTEKASGNRHLHLRHAAPDRVMRGLQGTVWAGVLAFATGVAIAALPLLLPKPAPEPYALAQ